MLVIAMPKLTDYCGATHRLTIDKAVKLDHKRYAAQPKLDGVFCRAATDRSGAIADLRYRSGEPVSKGDADGLVGLRLGLPDAVIYGELTAQTDAGLRERDAYGARLHVFDVSRFLGRDVRAQAYADRYGLLHRWHAHEELNLDGDYLVDESGRAHDATSGRFSQHVRNNLRRLPIVPLVRGKGAVDQLWQSYVEHDQGEGVVVVRLDLAFGARASKAKVKRTDTIDATVLRVEGKRAVLLWGPAQFVVSTTREQLAPGDVVEVKADGFTERGVPRFARFVRVRRDLGGTPTTHNAS